MEQQTSAIINQRPHGPVVTKHRTWQPEWITSDASVKVISYIGTASNQLGDDGDFYLDEMANVLYGPKRDGEWPEEGVIVSGPIVCKRNFIQLKTSRNKSLTLRKSSEKPGFFQIFVSVLRFCLPLKSKRPVALN